MPGRWLWVALTEVSCHNLPDQLWLNCRTCLFHVLVNFSLHQQKIRGLCYSTVGLA